MKHVIFYLSILLCSNIQARKLFLNESRLAIELGGGTGFLSNFDPVTNVYSPEIVFSNSNTKSNFFGHFYVASNINQKLLLKVGIEILLPKKLNSIEGSINEILIVTGKSVNYMVTPSVAVDIGLYETLNFRFFVGSSLGLSYLKSQIEYQYTDTGTSLLYKNFTEKTKSTGYNINPYLGIEFTLIDQYSFVINSGYRILPFNTLTTAESFSNGNDITYNDGGIILNRLGEKRSYSLSSFSFSASFRLYL